MNPEPRIDDPSLDDLGLARRIAAGDRSSFEFLMRRHNRRLYRLARATLRDDAEAEDALQEAYLAAYRAIGSFRGDSMLVTWLSRMVLNECLGRLRKSARRQNVIPMGPNDELESAPSPDDRDRPDRQAGRAEMRAMLERKLDQLPEDFRTVFVLRAVEELSVEETAASLGIPEATVRSRHFRARSLLRESLAQDFDVAERDLFDFGGAHCDRIVAGVLSRLEGRAQRERPGTPRRPAPSIPLNPPGGSRRPR
jgi:RNA polymerase sigma factor (sigma-70 family)